jgi:hypothetical protein
MRSGPQRRSPRATDARDNNNHQPRHHSDNPKNRDDRQPRSRPAADAIVLTNGGRKPGVAPAHRCTQPGDREGVPFPQQFVRAAAPCIGHKASLRPLRGQTNAADESAVRWERA